MNLINSSELVSDVASRLKEHKIESSRADAEIILCSLLNVRRVDLYTQEITLNIKQQRELQDMLTRRINREPLQYIVGKVDFYGCELFIEPGVFIPRPETEILVDTIVNICNQQPTTSNQQLFLDLCTGCGNIAISLTKTLTHCTIISSDISARALDLARRNAVLNGVYDKIEFIKADLFDLPKRYKGGFDIIVSNPPYIASEILEDLPAEVRKEPKEALDGGKKGLSFYLRILKESPYFLKEKGFVALELADGISDCVKEIFKGSSDFCSIKIVRDLNGIERVITAQRR